MCECYQTGGRFIDVDPDCPAHGAGGLNETVQEQADTIARLKAEVERLRAALRNIIGWLENPEAGSLEGDMGQARHIARAALKKGET